MTEQIRGEIRAKIAELRAWLKQLEWSKAQEPKVRADLARYEAAGAAFGDSAQPRKRARQGLARKMVWDWALKTCAADANPSKQERRNIADLIVRDGPANQSELCPDLETIRGEVDWLFRNWPPLLGSEEYERWEHKPKAPIEEHAQTLPSS